MPRPLDPVEIEADAWCLWCGDPLPEPEDRWQHQKFCSDKCRLAHYRDVSREKPRVRPRVACQWCGTEFQRSRASNVYCSKQCCADAYKAAHRRPGRVKPPETARTCVECGGTFHSRRIDRFYCSRRCSDIRRKRRARAKG